MAKQPAPKPDPKPSPPFGRAHAESAAAVPPYTLTHPASALNPSTVTGTGASSSPPRMREPQPTLPTGVKMAFVFMSDEQYAELHQAAELDGEKIGNWMAAQLSKAARHRVGSQEPPATEERQEEDERREEE